MQRDPKVALVLSSGAARGYAHLGVLEVLHAAGIKPDLIVGASFGGLVGAVYAAGRSPGEMADLARKVDIRTLLSLTDPVRPWDGLVAGEKLEAYFAYLVGHADFHALRTCAAVVATDIETGAPVVLDHGNVARAIRASTAIPGIFAPVRLGNHLLVDGTLSSGLPVWAVGTTRTQVTIAVDVTSEVDGTSTGAALIRRISDLPRRLPDVSREGSGGLKRFPPLPQVLRTLVRSARLLERAPEAPQYASGGNVILIRPHVERVRWFEFTNGDAIRRAGAEAAREALPAIERALAFNG